MILTEAPIANEMGGMRSLWVVCGLEEGRAAWRYSQEN
jgi:hypothetical protein